jgi:putative ATP-binding cassette transporter
MALTPEHPALPQERIVQHVQMRARCLARPRPGPTALRMLRRLGGAYRGAGGSRTLLLSGAVLAAVIAQLAAMLWLTQWNAAFFDALEQKDLAGVIRQSWMFLALVLAWMLAQAAGIEARRGLAIRLREHLTLSLIAGWMAEGRHFRIRNMEGSHDNEDGRIAEDARVVCEMVVEFLASFVYAVLQFVLFVGVLWMFSGPVSFMLGATVVTIPGHMVWVALLYAALGAGVTVLVGHPLVRATDRRQAAEADFRAGLLSALAHSPVIALTRAEPGERRRLAAAFGRVRAIWHDQTRSFRNLLLLSSGFSLLTSGLPMLILAPTHLSGQMSLGTLMQVTIAFTQVVAALSWLSDNYPNIAQWEASAERVLALAEASEDISEAACGTGPGRVWRAAENGPELAFHDVTLFASTGETLVEGLSAVIRPGERVLLEASPPAAAALFRAVAGLLPWGSGRIELPEGTAPFFLGERTYLPHGRLAEALSDPSPQSAIGEGAMAAALRAAGAGHFVPLLGQEADWEAEISLADQQRLGIARALLHAPRWILMHEATSALDAAEEARLITLLGERLPGSAIITITHRRTAETLFQRRIVVAPS